MNYLIFLLFIFSNFSVYAQGSYNWNEHNNAVDSIDWGLAYYGVLFLVFIVWIVNAISEKPYDVSSKKKAKEDIKTEKKKVVTEMDPVEAFILQSNLARRSVEKQMDQERKKNYVELAPWAVTIGALVYHTKHGTGTVMGISSSKEFADVLFRDDAFFERRIRRRDLEIK